MPMAMPSVTVMVQNSRGVRRPPLTPFLVVGLKPQGDDSGRGSFQQLSHAPRKAWISLPSAPWRNNRSDCGGGLRPLGDGGRELDFVEFHVGPEG